MRQHEDKMRFLIGREASRGLSGGDSLHVGTRCQSRDNDVGQLVHDNEAESPQGQRAGFAQAVVADVESGAIAVARPIENWK